MDINSKSFNSSIFNVGARYFVLLQKMFGARMVHDTSVHQIFWELYKVLLELNLWHANLSMQIWPCCMDRSNHQRCSIKKVSLEISQNSHQNTCARVSFLIKLQASGLFVIKKRMCRRCFPVNFTNTFFTEHLGKS